ncbi:MAG: dTMP kinase [Desulfobacteraceae bacterium 4572_130]|nr:MAG: dTMP kinase [Desulfobacteraceae bacterium 4572_130]
MFITFEGVEGSGKTTQIQNTLNFFRKAGYEPVVTREPGDTKIGRKIRSILLAPENNEMSSLCELFLYEADRAQHIFEVVGPSIRAGKIVLCDRFIDATIVYQGIARGIDKNFIEKIHEIVVQDIKPDLTILFDLDFKIGLKRTFKALKNGERVLAETRFEQEKMEFHQKIRNGYLELAAKEKQRFFIVDASLNCDQVFEQILYGIRERIGILK